MIIKRQIGEKGQVVIPKDIREYLKLKYGSNLIFEIKGKEVTIKPEEEAKDFIKEFLKHRKKGKSITLEEIKKIEDESYDLP